MRALIVLSDALKAAACAPGCYTTWKIENVIVARRPRQEARRGALAGEQTTRSSNWLRANKTLAKLPQTNCLGQRADHPLPACLGPPPKAD